MESGWLTVEQIRDGWPTTFGAASGVVAGPVAITPSCGTVNTVAAEYVLVTRSCGVPLRGLGSGFTAHGRRLHGLVLRGLARLAVSAGLARRLQRYRWNS